MGDKKINAPAFEQPNDAQGMTEEQIAAIMAENASLKKAVGSLNEKITSNGGSAMVVVPETYTVKTGKLAGKKIGFKEGVAMLRLPFDVEQTLKAPEYVRGTNAIKATWAIKQEAVMEYLAEVESGIIEVREDAFPAE